MKKLQGPKTGGLSFDTSNDALDYAKKLVERGDRLFSSKWGSLVESYKNKNSYLYVDIFGDGGSHVGQLSFFAVPSRHAADSEPTNVPVVETHTLICNSHFSERFVYFPVPKLVESPEGPISSILRIEGLKSQEKGPYGLWDLGTLASKIASGLDLGRTEGEFCVLRTGSPAEDSRAVKNRVIKTRSKTVQNIKQDDRQKLRHIDVDLSLEQNTPVLKIFINELSVGFFSHKGFFKSLKFYNVRLSPSEQQFGAFK